MQTLSSQTKNVTPSLCHLNCCNSPAVSNRDKWSIYWADGKQACCRVSGHGDWVFLKAVNPPSVWYFQAVEGVGVSLSDPEVIPPQQSKVQQSFLVGCLTCAFYTPSQLQQFPQGMQKKQETLVWCESCTFGELFQCSVLGWYSLCSTPSSRLFRNLCFIFFFLFFE